MNRTIENEPVRNRQAEQVTGWFVPTICKTNESDWNTPFYRWIVSNEPAILLSALIVTSLSSQRTYIVE